MSTNLLDSYSGLMREIRLIFAGELGESDLGHKQVIVLYRLSEKPYTMSELSAFTQSDPAATTRTVASLEKGGFVTRATDQKDARKLIIRLTKKGQAKAHFAHKIREKIEGLLSQTLTPTEQKQVAKLLKKAASQLQQRRKTEVKNVTRE